MWRGVDGKILAVLRDIDEEWKTAVQSLLDQLSSTESAQRIFATTDQWLPDDYEDQETYQVYVYFDGNRGSFDQGHAYYLDLQSADYGDRLMEAEALGAAVNFYPNHTDVVYPTISRKVADTVKELNIQVPADLANAGRIPLVVEAIRHLKEEVGSEVAIGAWVLGPYTLAGQLVDLSNLHKTAFKDTDAVQEVLDTLDGVLIEISKIYRAAGADYMTIREMGAGADILSPRMFKILIQPHLERIFAAIESPRVLHICGDTDSIVEQMALCGADAISVEQKNHVAESRQKVGPDTLILGNIDAYGVMVAGKPEDVDNSVKEAIANGVDAIWPGCDIWPTVSRENMEALMAATRKYGKLG